MRNRYVWGVDVAANKVAVAFDPGMDYRCVHVASRGARRLALLAAQLCDLIPGWAERYPPEVVWVEAPAGHHVHPSLDQAVGVTLASLWLCLSSVYEYPVPVELVSVGQWKKTAVGFGNASKDQVMEWAHRQGLEVDDQDVCDAYGVAVAGRKLVRWEQRKGVVVPLDPKPTGGDDDDDSDDGRTAA